MPFLQSRKKGKIRKEKLLLLSILSILCIGALGVGFAVWQESLVLVGTISTGNIDPVFLDASLQNSSKEVGSIVFSEDRKSMLINVEYNKNDSSVYFLYFTIKNEGALPIEIEDIEMTSGEALDLSMQDNPKSILDMQEKTEGRLKIQVDHNKLEEVKQCNFIVKLHYHQAGIR